MIYLFYGDNVDKARAKWHRVEDSFQTKYPAGAVFRFDAEHWNAAQFEELLQSRDLFGEKRLVVADCLLENPEALTFFEAAVKDLAESGTVFALLEIKAPLPLIKKIEKVRGKVELFENQAQAKKSEFNLFPLCDALGERDRRKLWVLFQQTLFAGVVSEEVFWKLVWQTKMMLLVAKSQPPLKTIKPFVAGKASRYAKNYSEPELVKLSGDLVALWHESKQENPIDFEIGLERLILNL